MKKAILPGSILLLAIMTGTAIAGETLITVYKQFNTVFTGDWQQYGQLFTTLQHDLIPRLFLLVITTVPLIFFLHYVAIGAKSFSHDGRQVYCYNLFVRTIHWIAALSFGLLVISGLSITFGTFFGNGTIGIMARNIHILSTLIFTGSAFFMLLLWMKDMLPALYDIKWVVIMGGYLSKDIKAVPAGKFNAGQKMWFWLATLGGGVMAGTGYFLYSHQGAADTLRLSAIIHNLLGAAMVAMFVIHLYMSLFAIKGSLTSMISGYKSEAELKILHSKFKF